MPEQSESCHTELVAAGRWMHFYTTSLRLHHAQRCSPGSLEAIEASGISFTERVLQATQWVLKPQTPYLDVWVVLEESNDWSALNLLESRHHLDGHFFKQKLDQIGQNGHQSPFDDF